MSEEERQGYLMAWTDILNAIEIAKDRVEDQLFVDGMILGASNALYFGYKFRFGDDPKQALEEFRNKV